MDIVERLEKCEPSYEIFEDAIAEIKRLRALTEWREIETAPKEIIDRNDSCGFGQYILVRPFWGNVPGVVRWCDDRDGRGEFITVYGTKPATAPTHWLPLPVPPRVHEPEPG